MALHARILSRQTPCLRPQVRNREHLERLEDCAWISTSKECHDLPESPPYNLNESPRRLTAIALSFDIQQSLRPPTDSPTSVSSPVLWSTAATSFLVNLPWCCPSGSRLQVFVRRARTPLSFKSATTSLLMSPLYRPIQKERAYFYACAYYPSYAPKLGPLAIVWNNLEKFAKEYLLPSYWLLILYGLLATALFYYYTRRPTMVVHIMIPAVDTYFISLRHKWQNDPELVDPVAFELLDRYAQSLSHRPLCIRLIVCSPQRPRCSQRAQERY